MIPALQNFRTYNLAVEFHRDCKQVKLTSPTLRDQLMRAAKCIVLTLAEGSAKPFPKDRARYYSMAMASFRECQAVFHLQERSDLLTKYDHLGACLYRLSRSPVP